jgi:toxin-antitoxin system PIN domain toxin
MSRTVDTNVLVYATHTASPFHDRARALLEHLVAGPGLAYLFWPVVLGYLRIVTHPNILGGPLSSGEAMSNVEALIAPAHIRVAGEGDDFWASFRTVTTDVKPDGGSRPRSESVATRRQSAMDTGGEAAGGARRGRRC